MVFQGNHNIVVCPDRVQRLGNMDPCMIVLINPKSNLHLTHLSVVCVCVCVCLHPRKHWPYRGSRCGATSSVTTRTICKAIVMQYTLSGATLPTNVSELVSGNTDTAESKK